MRSVSGGQIAFASCMTDTKRHQWGALLGVTSLAYLTILGLEAADGNRACWKEPDSLESQRR